ncbi:unnamed protein product [Notodromas monacha]|uniref:Dolichol-phosphate mannose synthase subunit 3 n=1 Tax=Notodromas monacha TaxID=399045 RepID=A0A7R9BZN4_9CRUS|nr:unnamed protein product [Notodromas monacha]CAG0924709.1 unnamed protein product [Notodromas monacha]
MTRLEHWLTYLLLLGVPWLLVVSGVISSSASEKYSAFIVFLPVVFLFAFASYVIGLFVMKVLRFNDCPEAAAELRSEIKRARADLASRGMFKEPRVPASRKRAYQHFQVSSETQKLVLPSGESTLHRYRGAGAQYAQAVARRREPDGISKVEAYLGVRVSNGNGNSQSCSQVSKSSLLAAIVSYYIIFEL